MLWCSSRCYKQKPPKIVWIELKFGDRFRRDIKDVLIDTTRTFQTLGAQCSALDISIPYLYTIVEKHFDLPLPAFMALHATGKRKKDYLESIREKKGPLYAEALQELPSAEFLALHAVRGRRRRYRRALETEKGEAYVAELIKKWTAAPAGKKKRTSENSTAGRSSATRSKASPKRSPRSQSSRSTPKSSSGSRDSRAS